jgi:hypothetical protein
MLGHLLSSKPKSKLINLFLAHPQRSFSATELRTYTGIGTDFMKKTLKELAKMEFVTVTGKKMVRYYQVNKHFALYPELLNMLAKNKSHPEDMLAKAAVKVGDCKLIAFTGVFAGKPRIETDVLFVGRVSPKKLEGFLRMAEKFAEQEVSFTVFSPSEFEYRQVMNDRFVKNILENGPALILDKLKNKSYQKTR